MSAQNTVIVCACACARWQPKKLWRKADHFVSFTQGLAEPSALSAERPFRGGPITILNNDTNARLFFSNNDQFYRNRCGQSSLPPLLPPPLFPRSPLFMFPSPHDTNARPYRLEKKSAVLAFREGVNNVSRVARGPAGPCMPKPDCDLADKMCNRLHARDCV